VAYQRGHASADIISASYLVTNNIKRARANIGGGNMARGSAAKSGIISGNARQLSYRKRAAITSPGVFDV